MHIFTTYHHFVAYNIVYRDAEDCIFNDNGGISIPQISTFFLKNIHFSYEELESETLSMYKRISQISILGDFII